MHYFYICKWICPSSSHLEIIIPQQLRKGTQKQILKSRNLACFESRCLPGILNTIFFKFISFSSKPLPFMRFYSCRLRFCLQLCLQNFYIGWVRISNMVINESKGICVRMHLHSKYVAFAWITCFGGSLMHLPKLAKNFKVLPTRYIHIHKHTW